MPFYLATDEGLRGMPALKAQLAQANQNINRDIVEIKLDTDRAKELVKSSRTRSKGERLQQYVEDLKACLRRMVPGQRRVIDNVIASEEAKGERTNLTRREFVELGQISEKLSALATNPDMAATYHQCGGNARDTCVGA